MEYYTLTEILTELKHSVYLHVTLQAGPSPQLSVFLIKLLDLVDDLQKLAEDSRLDDTQRSEITTRIKTEASQIAFHIVEALAIWTQRAIDDRKAKATKRGDTFPEHIQRCGDALLILVGRARSFPDKIAAKNTILLGIAEALRALQTYTKATYPEVRDAKHNLL